MTRWLERSIAEIAVGLRARETTATRLLNEAQEAHDRWDHDLKAYKFWDPERAAHHARAADAAIAGGHDPGPLLGIPVSVKDLYGLTGYPTFAGTPTELPPSWSLDGPLMRVLRRQCPVLAGKTHTVEFAFGGLGTNRHWGTPRNPWDGSTHRVPGGSSAGAGVSLMEGSALLAFGSDTAGSVRIPASMTGCAGLKVTHGRWPLEGIVPLSPTLDTPGILTRSVEDLAYGFYALDPAHAGKPLPDPLPVAEMCGLRLGVVEKLFWQDLSPGIGEAADRAIDDLVQAGARKVPLTLPELVTAAALHAEGGVAAPELCAFLVKNLSPWLETVDPVVARRMAAVKEMSAEDYLDRLARIHAMGRSANETLAAVDLLVSPTVALTPPATEEVADGDAYAAANLAALRNTSPANYLGLCAITLPCGLDAAGMPVGLQLMARGGTEERLFAIALAAERVLGTAVERIGRPPLGGSGG